ncbi:hypothetical protein LXA43DRAFT_1103196 [Ganoderma leucocontextum]|nr:hypothetical protein LXA43DRAFT_1103196 [Ganoderma leucocontextum]
MLHKPSTVLVLLSALSHYYVSGAVVSLVIPFADPDEAITANFLGTDAEGHTSWSLGPGVTSGSFTNTDFDRDTLVAGATDVHEVGALSTVLDGVTLTLTASAGCSLATGVSGGAVSAACSALGQAVGAFSGTATTTAITTAFTSQVALIAVQVPDSGSGAVPTAAATSAGGTPSDTGSAPSTKNAAVKGRIGWGVAGAAGFLLAGLV